MHAAKSPARRPRLLVPILVVAVAAGLIAAVLALQPQSEPSGGATGNTGGTGHAGESTSDGSAAQTETVDLTQFERRDQADVLAAGPTDAPIGLIIFSDYQCPYCAKWNAETLPEMQRYADAGQLRIEWRDLNVFGDASERASRASYAAGLQGKFWEYHEELFANGEKRQESDLSDAALIALAGELGLDQDRFATDLTAPATVAEITANATLGRNLGAASTPVFLLGGTPISGAQPTEVFTDAVDRALAAQQG